jgi:hypothetical protein
LLKKAAGLGLIGVKTQGLLNFRGSLSAPASAE